MKVICINNKPLPGRSHNKATVILKEGNVYNVIDTLYDFGLPPAYQLSECPDLAFCSTRFILLSDIDETEFERNYKTETINA